MILDTLIPYVQIVASSVPDNVALISLRDSARRFLRKVHLWQTDLTLSSVADQAAYAMATTAEVDSGAVPIVFRILEVKKDGTTISDVGYRLRTSDGYLVFETNFIPPATDTDDIVVKVVLEPAFDGIHFPQWIVEKYVDAIVGGALDRLMNTPNKPYSDPAGARVFKVDYKRGIVKGRADLASFGTDRETGYVSSNNDTGGIRA